MAYSNSGIDMGESILRQRQGKVVLIHVTIPFYDCEGGGGGGGGVELHLLQMFFFVRIIHFIQFHDIPYGLSLFITQLVDQTNQKPAMLCIYSDKRLIEKILKFHKVPLYYSEMSQ